ETCALRILAPAVGRIAGALARMAAGGGTSWRQDIPAELLAPMDEGDLMELLGALLENAAKWAVSDVLVAARAEGASVVLLIEDDGPGIPSQHRLAALARGVRLDPGRSGTGLGLAIADDIVRAYGGDLRLEEAASGGLRVRVVLPVRPGAAPATPAPARISLAPTGDPALD
ncbi:ATP-binding protein, partial [Falsiroseomonas oryziterrae]|uniref:ATP-binding protein n=1 Tax=Falsiroseomonas oryziterrae TaxID=2911368 RepID=UPI001F3BF1BC